MTRRAQTLLLTILAVATGVGSLRAGDQPLVWGKAVDGFQLALSFDSTRRLPSGAPALRVYFRNASIADRSVILNLESAMPELYYSSDILTLLVKDSSGKSERLANIDLYSGRRSNFEIPMPMGAAYSMPLDFDYHHALTESGMAKDLESPGSAKNACAFQAVMTVDLWQELLTVTSNGLAASSSTLSGADQGESGWGAPVNGLQMAISLRPVADVASRLLPIRLHLRNVGPTDFHVTLGGGCATRKSKLANGPIGVNRVTLNLTDSSGNTKQLYEYSTAEPQGCAGGIWIFDVPMAPGAVYSVPLTLACYKTPTHSRVTRSFERGWRPGGTYTLRAVLKLRPRFGNPSGQFLGPSWAGTITSRGLEVHFPTQ